LQVSWKTANLMLNKLSVAMADRDAKYQLIPIQRLNSVQS
jgi:hypothetical protein